MYLLTVLGNLLVILAATSDPRLHTPMCFFLSNLSLVDVGFTSTTIPKMLLSLHTHSRAVSYAGCVIQIYFFTLFIGLDDFLLAVMAYDRFGAICHPLRYAIIMSPRLCVLLVLGSWVTSALNSLLQSLLVQQLSFCEALEIPHFFCEPNQLAHVSCSDTSLNRIALYCAAGLLGGSALVGILYSHYKIVSSIRAMSTAQGRYKAFSTCASHLSVVSLSYGTLLGVYFSSEVIQNPHSSTTASVMYTVVTPMLNPFIYSLRNKDLKRALAMFLEKETRQVLTVLDVRKGI
ncbi:olfactory receptor 7A10-like [Dipodomys spectabilis]|uniref:olfactory receptor 7A10-like n=1 Tax=Dipodomys spectabilis TaxID=105255 RepID=UPI001C535E2E|nr:olfactory receptor 7A10-like [Dipodomys spectabilis]